MKNGLVGATLTCLWSLTTLAQPPVAKTPATFIKPGENLVLEGIPSIAATIGEETSRYGESRASLLLGWHPQRREMLIATRFGETNQVHAVALPDGARRQLTFYSDAVKDATFLPDGNSFLVQKDIGGGEWYQIFRHDLVSGNVTLLTDGHSRNEAYMLAHNSTTMVYTSTQRNNKDNDLWLTDAAATDAHSQARLLMRVDGGGWSPLAWSRDNTQLIVLQSISINESYLWLVDATSGTRKLVTPRPTKGAATIAYSAAAFDSDGSGIYVATDRDSEFHRLAHIDLKSSQVRYLTSEIHWDVDSFAASEDGRSIAFTVNENGSSKLYLLDTASGAFHPLPNAPEGVISDLAFHPNSRDLGFALTSAKVPSDVYSIDVMTGKLDRWTTGETGGLNANNFVDPTLVRWKSFDGLELTGFLYAPDPARFPGKRPIIVKIHGGPEGQARPHFMGRENYLLNVLGVAVLEPNVRGSSGYGKTFLKRDNGLRRADTYKDVDTLLDWIAAQNMLDADRVMMYGGSYGGHMTWAVSAFYNDRIRCAMPIVGMSNLVTFLEHTEEYRRDLRRVEYGDERVPAMRAYLEKIAPMNHLQAMHKPIFAVVGKNDPRVPWSESRQIVDKLNAQGTKTWFLIANDEGHGYAKKKNRDFLFNAEVAFISQYLTDGMSNSN